MVGMSSEARATFTEKVPKSIRDGLDHTQYSSLWEEFKSGFTNMFDDIGFAARTMWQWIKNLFTGKSLNIKEVQRQVAKDGSHANGLDYVPKDGYIAELHKGEAVLTRAEADAYRKGFNGGTVFIGVTIQVNGANIKNEEALAEKIAYKLQRMTERKGAVYA